MWILRAKLLRTCLRWLVFKNLTPHHTTLWITIGQNISTCTLGNVIRALPVKSKAKWSQLLWTLTFSYNCTVCTCRIHLWWSFRHPWSDHPCRVFRQCQNSPEPEHVPEPVESTESLPGSTPNESSSCVLIPISVPIICEQPTSTLTSPWLGISARPPNRLICEIDSHQIVGSDSYSDALINYTKMYLMHLSFWTSQSSAFKIFAVIELYEYV